MLPPHVSPKTDDQDLVFVTQAAQAFQEDQELWEGLFLV